MAVHFYLASSPWRWGPDRPELEFMHLALDDALEAYFKSLAREVDVAGLDELDPYGDDYSWSPAEAATVAERLQALYDALWGDMQASRKRRVGDVRGGLWPWGRAGEWEPPKEAGGRGGVAAFLFWLRRAFLEAAQRDLYVIGLGD